MSELRQSFLSGDRPDDIALFLSDTFVDDIESLAEYGERAEDGIVLVVDGETGRQVFETATSMQAMDFAGQAMGREGEIAPDLSGGRCPDRGTDDEHRAQFVFSFVEEQNTDVDGLVAEGDAVFAYAYCSCGTAYSHRWLVGERPTLE
jgi:hypothetical protein